MKTLQMFITEAAKFDSMVFQHFNGDPYRLFAYKFTDFMSKVGDQIEKEDPNHPFEIQDNHKSDVVKFRLQLDPVCADPKEESSIKGLKFYYIIFLKKGKEDLTRANIDYVMMYCEDPKYKNGEFTHAFNATDSADRLAAYNFFVTSVSKYKNVSK
jgi:hypothetical protein